jgi:hypothetical protein
MRLEVKERGSMIIGEEEIRARNEEKKKRHKEESKRRGKMMAMATRLARRPWKKQEQEKAEKNKDGEGVDRDEERQAEETTACDTANNGHAEQEYCYDEYEEVDKSTGRCSLHQRDDEFGDGE